MSQVPAVSRSGDLTRATERVFADQGPLARAIPKFEPRQSQREMARHVADVLSEGGTLLAEAGTGTGKTLAYLVPAILARQRVLVSTGTKNLQEQIYLKDIPALRAALSVEFTATCMKGRANYLCLHRLDQLRAGGGDVGPPAARGVPPLLLDRLADWAHTTETGDRAELDELPEHSDVWNAVAATSDTCLGSECPQYQQCFVTRMRQHAAASDIVIVNHHLLCADASVRQSSFGEVIPECRHLIVDEAHQLEDIATQYFGLSVSTYRLDELVRDTERLLNTGGVGDDDGTLRRAVARVDQHARALFGGLAMAVRSRARGGDERLRVSADWFGDLIDDGLALLSALEGLEAGMMLAGGQSGGAGSREPNEDALTIARRATEIRDDLRFLLAASDAGYVFFVEGRGRGLFLRAAPIDVSSIIRDLLLDRPGGTVLTSATLAVQGSFDYVRRRLGVNRAIELRVPSEFDFTQQTLLYLPRAMPPPKSPRFAEAVAEQVVHIVRRTEGRAFVLFTSYATLHTVYEHAMHTLPYPLLVQGTAPRGALLDQFRTTPHAVLFATSSFWQGVDVVGEQLSCVIIDKLPFASPGDPITAARIEAIAAAGGDAFGEYQVPLAILTLLQGLGRLIRHRTDRGILAVLDPRLRTMGYGRRFLESLPPAPLVQDLGAIERFFG